MINKSVEEHSLYCTKYELSVKRAFFFGIISFLYRHFFNRKPKPSKTGKNYLNLGCGLLRYENFINADFYFRFSWLKKPYFPDWLLDLRYPLKCYDNFWDGVFTQHAFEHLYPAEVKVLLKELFRTMKNGAYIRISVPDLEKYVDYYNGNLPDKKFKQWQTGAEAIRSLTQNYEHISCWDTELLSRLLKEIGFKNIKKMNFNESSDTMLAKDSEDHRFESLYLEAQK
jgi:predicted SAM-dependent methyltransferase